MAEQIDPAHIGEAFQRLTAYPVTGGPAGAVWTGPIADGTRLKGVAPPIRLPDVVQDGGMPLWTAIQKRSTERAYRREPVTAEQLAQLLWTANGIRRAPNAKIRRTIPSAAGAYPIETYVAAHNVAGIAPGLYHHDPSDHSLLPLRLGDVRLELARICQGQVFCANAAVVLIWTAMVGRTVRTCSQRGFRYIYIEAGHVAQNLALAATALGLGSCQIGGFYDELALPFLGANPHQEAVLYMSTIGAPA